MSEVSLGELLESEMQKRGWSAAHLGELLVEDQTKAGRKVSKSMRQAVWGWLRKGKIPRRYLREALIRVFGWDGAEQTAFFAACGRPAKLAA